MSVESPRSVVFNLPNQLSILRLILAVILFAFVANEFYATSAVLFAAAAATDWLDGFLARKYGLVTTLGRILDPFADKVVVCGAFIMLCAIPEMNRPDWGLKSWMVVIIVGRELLVTALRSFIEDRGGDFSAKWSGKWKMGLQCGAAIAAFVYLAWDGSGAAVPLWLVAVTAGFIWAALLMTIYTGYVYVTAAIQMVRNPNPSP